MVTTTYSPYSYQAPTQQFQPPPTYSAAPVAGQRTYQPQAATQQAPAVTTTATTVVSNPPASAPGYGEAPPPYNPTAGV